MSPGGVGRNIAETLALFGETVNLISAFGADSLGTFLRNELIRSGVGIQGSLLVEEIGTSVYLCVLERSRALHVAVSDMRIVDLITPDVIRKRRDLIAASDLCVVDANLSRDTIEHIAKTVRSVPLILDTVSAAKAGRAAGCFGSFCAVKPNREEAGILTGTAIRNNRDLSRAAARFHSAGTERVFISLGEHGLFYSDSSAQGIAAPAPFNVVNVSGAGDALTAALAFGMTHGFDIEYSARYAVAAASLTAASDRTVSPLLGPETVAAAADDVRIKDLEGESEDAC